MTAKLQAVCAVCFNTHKLYANGNLVRHGFAIHGRRNGEYGLAWHTGPCNGVSFPHFGISTAGTIWALGEVRAALAHAEQKIAWLKTEPALPWHADSATRLFKQGFMAEITVQAGAAEVRYAKVVDYMPEWEGNSREYFHLPSYATLHQRELSVWTTKQASCQRSIAFYEKAIATWEPKDAVPVKPETKRHGRSTWKHTSDLAPACKQWSTRRPVGSYNYADTPEEVNCKSCQRSMAAAKKEAEKHAKRVEKALSVKKGAGRALLVEMVETGRAPAEYDSNTMHRLQDAALVKREGGHSDDYVPTDAGREALKGTK